MSVPVRGPRLLSINSTTTSVKLRWAAIPQRHVNGILRGYDVIINAVHYRMTSALQVNASSLGVEVPGLRRNTTYRVRLRGFTRVRGIKRGGTFGSVHNFTIKFGEWRLSLKLKSKTITKATGPVAAHTQSSSNFSCSLTSNITSHNTKNLAFHSLLRLKDDYVPNSHYVTYTFSL